MAKFEDELNTIIPNPRCELNYTNVFELLIAVILSAQCTDKRVNIVTKELFKKYNTPQDFANLTVEELGKEIYSLGFYNSKAKSIINASKDIVAKFDGKVPSNMKDLTSLSGVGRKTASVVLAEGFKQPAFAVDTHVFRVSNRLGIGDKKSVEKCEEKLKKHFPKSSWGRVHMQLVQFGRYYCKAQNPKCDGCILQKNCLYYQNKGKKNVS